MNYARYKRGDAYGDNDVEIGSPLAASVSAYGDVDVIAQPLGETDVPTMPKVGDAMGKVGIVEILLQADAEHGSRTDGYERVAGKVGV